MNSILSGEQLVHLQAKTNYELPSSGLKEFEPNNSWLEQKQIQSALDERKALLEEERVEKWNILMEAEWIPDRHKAEVKRKNKHWEVFGHHSDGKDWLFPEEVLYLMEMNCLECYFGEVPLSIQKGYTVLLRPESGCSITEYRVFSHLSRAGYRVMRHLPDLTVTAYERQIRLDQHLEQKKTYSDMTIAEQEIARPDLPPKKILELSDNVEVLIKAKETPSNQAGQVCPEEDEVLIISPERHKQSVKKSIEVIDLADSSEESSDESSDSDIEIIQEKPPSGIIKKPIKTEDYMKCEVYDDDGDVEIMEVAVPKKEIIVTTIESSDSEQDDNAKESDSDKSYDGNWKRRQPYKNRKPFIRPAQMDNFKYLAIEEFCLDRNVNSNVGRGKENVQSANKDNLNGKEISESLDSSDSIEFLSLQSQSSRQPFSVLKSRTEILDMMPSMAKQKIMTIDSPDLRLIPDSINPKQNIYTYNTNIFKARLFSSFRPGYRGRRYFHRPMFNNYNSFHNDTNMFHYNQLALRSPLLSNPTLTQMFGSDVQSVATGMMQFASALLNNSTLPNYQTNNTLPFSFPLNNINNRSIHQSPQLHSQPMFDDTSRRFSTPNHVRFSDSPVSLNDNFQQPLQSPSFGDRREIPFNSEYNRRSFTPPSRRHHGWNMNRTGRSRPFGRTHLSRHSERFAPPHMVALDDPAYMRPDIPVRESEDRLGNKGDVNQSSQIIKNAIEIIDIEDEDDNFTPPKFISNKFNRKRKLTKKMVRNRFGKKKKFQKQKGNKNEVSAIIFLDSPTGSSSCLDVPLKEEVKETLVLPNITFKTETALSESTTVKQEVLQQQTDIKQEKADVHVKVEIEVDLGQIKTEPSSDVSVKVEHDNSAIDIKPDESSEVKQEPSVPGEEVLIKTESSTDTTSVILENEGSHSVSAHSAPSSSTCEPIIEKESDSLSNKQSNEMEIDDVNENEVVDNTHENGFVKPDVPPELNQEPSVPGEEVLIKTEPSTDTTSVILENEVSYGVTAHTTPSISTCEPIIEKGSDSLTNKQSNEMEINDVNENELVDNSDVNGFVSGEPNNSDLSRTTENFSNVVNHTDSSEKSREIVGSDTTDRVKSWAEMKEQSVPLGRTGEREDDSSSEEEGDEIQPVIRPKHCKTIGTVLSALQIFSPFTPEVPVNISKLKISFDMYLATDFRKAQRSLPQYRIVVFGGMDPIPSPAQFQELQTRFKDKVLVLRAVVMPNSVVFYNCSSISLPVDDKSHIT